MAARARSTSPVSSRADLVPELRKLLSADVPVTTSFKASSTAERLYTLYRALHPQGDYGSNEGKIAPQAGRTDSPIVSGLVTHLVKQSPKDVRQSMVNAFKVKARSKSDGSSNFLRMSIEELSSNDVVWGAVAQAVAANGGPNDRGLQPLEWYMCRVPPPEGPTFASCIHRRMYRETAQQMVRDLVAVLPAKGKFDGNIHDLCTAAMNNSSSFYGETATQAFLTSLGAHLNKLDEKERCGIDTRLGARCTSSDNLRCTDYNYCAAEKTILLEQLSRVLDECDRNGLVATMGNPDHPDWKIWELVTERHNAAVAESGLEKVPRSAVGIVTKLREIGEFPFDPDLPPRYWSDKDHELLKKTFGEFVQEHAQKEVVFDSMIESVTKEFNAGAEIERSESAIWRRLWVLQLFKTDDARAVTFVEPPPQPRCTDMSEARAKKLVAEWILMAGTFSKRPGGHALRELELPHARHFSRFFSITSLSVFEKLDRVGVVPSCIWGMYGQAAAQIGAELEPTADSDKYTSLAMHENTKMLQNLPNPLLQLSASDGEAHECYIAQYNRLYAALGDDRDLNRIEATDDELQHLAAWSAALCTLLFFDPKNQWQLRQNGPVCALSQRSITHWWHLSMDRLFSGSHAAPWLLLPSACACNVARRTSDIHYAGAYFQGAAAARFLRPDALSDAVIEVQPLSFFVHKANLFAVILDMARADAAMPVPRLGEVDIPTGCKPIMSKWRDAMAEVTNNGGPVDSRPRSLMRDSRLKQWQESGGFPLYLANIAASMSAPSTVVTQRALQEFNTSPFSSSTRASHWAIKLGGHVGHSAKLTPEDAECKGRDRMGFNAIAPDGERVFIDRRVVAKRGEIVQWSLTQRERCPDGTIACSGCGLDFQKPENAFLVGLDREHSDIVDGARPPVYWDDHNLVPCCVLCNMKKANYVSTFQNAIGTRVQVAAMRHWQQQGNANTPIRIPINTILGDVMKSFEQPTDGASQPRPTTLHELITRGKLLVESLPWVADNYKSIVFSL